MTTVLTFVLAGLLGPSSFGVLAMALVFVGLIEMMLQQGLLPAIVQRKELRPEHADTAFWCVLGAGSLLTAACLLLAPLWAAVNNLPQLTAVIWALSPLIPIQALVVVQEALLRRELRFRALALRGTAATLCGGIAGVAAALQGWGVWSLVLQQLVTASAGVFVLWAASGWRPSRRFDRTAAGELYAYSLRSSGATIGLFLGNRADVLVAGAFFGPLVVGIYRLAHRLTSLALEVGSRAMQGVALPALSELQGDSETFCRRWAQMQRATTVITLPLLALLGCAAPELVALLGPEWSGAVAAIQILAVVQAFTALSLLSGPVLQAIGKPGVLALLVWARAVVLVVALGVAGAVLPGADAQQQLLAMLLVALGVVVVSGISSVVVASRAVGMPLVRLVTASLPGGAAAAGVVALLLLTTPWLSVFAPWAALVIKSTSALLVVIAVVLTTQPELRRRLHPQLLLLRAGS